MSPLQPAQLLSAAQQYLNAGRYAQAIELLQRSLTAAPGSFAAHSLLGIAYHAAGDFDGAVTHLRVALTLQNNWAEGYQLLGRTFAGREMYPQAADQFRQAVRLQPQNVGALNNLGAILKSLGLFTEAIEHLRLAATLRPDQAEIHSNLGSALLESGQTPEALAQMQHAVALRPDFLPLYQGLGNALISVGQVSQAIDCFQQALNLAPTHHQIHSSLLLSLHYIDSADENPQALFQQHLDYNLQHTASLPRPTSYSNNADPNRRLRIGYFSADFRRHSVSFFIEPILAHHDLSKFEIFCYAEVTNPDDVTARLQRCASHWRNVIGQTDEQIAQQMQADHVDILVDLSGHSGGGRLALFARKPAPVQISYLGYPDTTGLSAIDYRISDSIADPPGESDRRYSEQLIRLDPLFLCFQPPAGSPEVSPPPALGNEHITFGSFNNLAKISPGTIKLWSGVLNAVAGSRLLIKARGLQHPAVADRLAASFLSFGIEPHRLQFLGHEPTTPAHLARYHQVDIALDTWPYNGVTTTCEALWMGVPVVTLSGRIHAARVGATLLSALGRTEWIARGPDQFVTIAAELAADRPKLAHLRASLRQQFLSSPITDASAFIRRLEIVFQQIWRRAKPAVMDSSTSRRL